MVNLRETIEYKEYGYSIVTCPVCGKETLDNYWICEHCGWEYDNTVTNDNYSFANQCTLEYYKSKYQEGKLDG